MEGGRGCPLRHSSGDLRDSWGQPENSNSRETQGSQGHGFSGSGNFTVCLVGRIRGCAAVRCDVHEGTEPSVTQAWVQIWVLNLTSSLSLCSLLRKAK